MKKPYRTKFSTVVLSLLFGAILALTGLLYLIHPTNKVIATWQQPDGSKYDEFPPYCLTVVEGGYDVSRLPPQRLYCIYVGTDSGKPTHGHLIDFSFHPDGEATQDIENFIKRSSVVWGSDGVTFEDASGYRVFIPKKVFAGAS